MDAGGTHPYDFVVIRVFWGVGGGGAVMDGVCSCCLRCATGVEMVNATIILFSYLCFNLRNA